MADNKFDLSKLKENVGGLMGSIKSMINPSSAVPTVNPDDALGLKIAEIATMSKQLTDAQQEQTKKLQQLNELVNDAFQDIEALRNQAKSEKKPVTAEAASAAAVKKAHEVPIEDEKTGN